MKTTDCELVQVSLKSLIDLAPLAQQLKLPTIIKAQQGGIYRSPFKGRGMEFDESRPYQHGDDVRNIDWPVTARSGKAHTKLFRQERERPVLISVDLRPAMQFATRGVFKSVLASQLAGLIAWSAQEQGDRIGGQLLTQSHCYELKPQSGKSAVLRFLQALSEPNSHQTRQSPLSFDQALLRLNRHAYAGSLLYIISDFRGLSQQSNPYLQQLAKHCTVILIFVYDPLEKQLPRKGIYRFTDSQQSLSIDGQNPVNQQRYQHQFQQRLQHLTQLAQQKSIYLLSCVTTDKPVDCLVYQRSHSLLYAN